MNNILKWVIIIFTILIFAYAFSASYNSQNIDRLDYVIALGIDKAPSENNLQVSFEFTDLGSFSESNSSSENSKPIINSVVAPSIPEAINLMNAYAGKQINLSHCKVVVFSEEIAKNGILKEVTYLMNAPQIRPTTNMIVSTENAKDYIENSTSSLEGILTKYYDIFPTSAEYTGYTSNILLDTFYKNITNTESGAIAILGNTSNSSDNSSLDSISPGETIAEGDRGTKNIGLAVFKGSNYIGNLSALDTLCYTLIEEEVDNFSISVQDPFNENNKIDLSVSSLEPAHIEVDTSKENPAISIKFNLTAKALTGQDSLDFSNSETLNKINESLKNFITTKMKDYLYKTSREYNCDLNNFYMLAKHKFLTIR